MKKAARGFLTIIIITALVALSACGAPADGGSRGDDTQSALSKPADDATSRLAEESDASEPEPDSQPVSSGDSGTDSSDEPGESSAEPVSEEVSVGDLFGPYLEIISSGRYMLKTSETKTIGGEAVLYTVTAYHSDGIVYAVISEDGNESRYLIQNNRLIILDDFEKMAIVTEYGGDMFREKTLWHGDITLKSTGVRTLFDSVYNTETYADSEGFEFTLFFSGNVLKRYLSYDETVRDTVVISVSVSDNLDGAVFAIPAGYTVTDTVE